jgi:hypothetical protein
VDKEQVVVVKGDKHFHLSAPPTSTRLDAKLVEKLEGYKENPFVIISAKRDRNGFHFDIDVGDEAKTRVHFIKQKARTYDFERLLHLIAGNCQR